MATLIPWTMYVGETLQAGDAVAISPTAGKVVRWRPGLEYLTIARREYLAGDPISSQDVD
ncbi:MAG TPA: hypothetical protein VMY76_12820 [Gemmatimonadales bacterium]|nr:hypothetical protein [Gemmatimonadales bacterium]